MRLADISLPGPDEEISVGPTGDLVLVAGLDSLEQWTPRALTTPPGALLHRPAFGAGLERYLGRAGALPSLVAGARATLLSDRRVASVRVTAQASSTSPGHVDVSSEVVTVDEQRGLLSVEV